MLFAGKVVDAPTATDLVLRDGAVEFRDVSFGYEPGLSVLKGVRKEKNHDRNLLSRRFRDQLA
jgi:ABC-type transport system involved in Fe-S cluster assembly fused permease/ATPase subunit